MKRRALFIGVNEYADNQIRDLRCSVRDAHSMNDLFEEIGYEARCLENPGKGSVFQAVSEMTAGLKAGDQFLFYFAGHGFTDSGQHLLFCSDDRHELLRFHRAGIPFDLLELETRTGGFDRSFLLDACQSDFLTGTRGGDASTRDMIAIGDMVPSAEDAPGSFYVLRSCSKYEHALEIESRSHGLFTLAMMDVLRQSRRSGAELLFNDALRETVREKMYVIARGAGVTAKQTPESDGRGALQVLISGRKAAVEQVPPQPPPPQHHQPAAVPEKKTSGVAPVKTPAPAKPTEDVRSRPPSPPSEEELRRIEELGREMFAKKRAALRRKGELDPYRSDSAGLLIHLQGADRLLERISSASPFATLADTANAARALDGDIEALGRELAWLKENKSWRDEARSLSKSVDSLDADLARFKAVELAYAAYTSGMLARTQAKAAFDAGKFLVAKTRYADAKKSLAEAIRKSRGVLANLELEDADAHDFAERCQWRDCIAACDRALAIDPKCDEAARLKAKARNEMERKRKTEILSAILADVRDLAEHRQWRDCIAACDRALAIDPKCDEAARLKAKAQRQAREETERKAREEAERKIEAERKAREDTECRAREARQVAERKAREEAAWRAYQEEESRKAGMTKTITLPGGAKMEMIYCPPGEFMMGSPTSEEGRYDDETQHRLRLTKGFWLGKYSVTQRQWQSVMGNNPSNFKSSGVMSWFTGGDLPVEEVSWDDCQVFIKKVNAALGCGARLQTEAEWEYACRAGTTTAYFWGNALNGDRANCDGNNPCGTKTKGPYLARTTPVGKYGANPWGLCDMHGNVWEWCADWYGKYSGDAVDPTGPASGEYRVLRGGSWYRSARSCRSANRSRCGPGYRYDLCGFRLCCSVGPRGQRAEP